MVQLSSASQVFLLICCVAGLVGVAGCCCTDAVHQVEQEIAAIEADRQAHVGEWTLVARQRAEIFGQLGAQLDPDAFDGSLTCPDETIAAALPDPAVRLTMLSVDLDTLKGRASDESNSWTWLDHDHIADLQAIARDPDGTFDDRLFEHCGIPGCRSLIVLVPHGLRSVPTNFTSGLIKGKSFDGGLFAGSVVIVDLDTGGAVLCFAPFEAASGDSVSVGDNETARRAVEREFKENVDDAVNDALREISDHARVNLVGLL